MRYVLVLLALIVCSEMADAGPIIDRCRDRRAAQQPGGPIFPRLVARPAASGGCQSGQCQQVQSGTVYYSIQPAGCANGQCPVPARK